MLILRLGRNALCATLLLVTALPARAADAPIQIWFTPLTENIKPSGHGLEYVQHDFPALLKPDAPWQQAASRLSVLQLQGNVVWSYPDIPSLIAFLHSHPWKIALSFGMMFDGGSCPQRLEGISADPDVNHESVKIAQLWKQDGGSLDEIVMDGPFWFGHYQDKACQYTTEEVARRTAATLRGILGYFPNAKVVDAEGPAWIADDEWLAEMARFRTALQAASGHTIDSVALDLHWHDLRPGNDWQTTTQRATAYFHRLGVTVGLTINADGGPGVTDESWIAANRDHLREAAAGRLGLDFISINQWMQHVRLNLPESDPSAYTSLINDAHDLYQGAAAH